MAQRCVLCMKEQQDGTCICNVGSAIVSDATQRPAVQRLSVTSVEATRRWSPQYVRPTPMARGVQRVSTVNSTDTRHWLTPPTRRGRSSGSGSGSTTDTDSSTDDCRYTALDLQPARRYRRRCPARFRPSERHDADDNFVCKLLSSSSLFQHFDL